MNSITAKNVNVAFREGIWLMRAIGQREDSRNGPVLVAPGPVVTTYLNPLERVLFNPTRDANPIFHLMESLWMLAGEDHVAFLLPFNPRFKEYAEDNGICHGAYGQRWRIAFGVDQLRTVAHMLQKDPHSRRAVMAMWNPYIDLAAEKRDLPCNTHIYFDCRGGKLNMTVCCRSNDMLWGAYGANAVHMSMMQEWMAAAVGVPVGKYIQFSNNMHLYTELPMVQTLLATPPYNNYDFYSDGEAEVIPLVGRGEFPEDVLKDCFTLVTGGALFKTHFVGRVAYPLGLAYTARKAGQPYEDVLATVPECDWKLAFTQWVNRRIQPGE